MSGNGNGRPRLLHQIVFRWDARNADGSGGYGPAAYSCDPQDALDIHEEIRTTIRPDDAQPRDSLGRLSLSDGRALAFKRVPAGDSTGRSAPICLAIVGDGELLSPGRSLGLRYWRWPSERISTEQFGQVLKPVDVQAVIDEAANERVPLIKGLETHPAQLDFIGLVAASLEYPWARLLVLEQGLAADPTALAFGLAKLFGSFWSDGWNFSTYETRDSGAYQLAFTPAWPETVTQADDLIRVDLRVSDTDPRIVPLARKIVALYMRNDISGLVALQKAANRTGFPDADLLRQILLGLHGQAQPKPSRKTAVTSGATTRVAPRPVAAPTTSIPVAMPVPDVPVRRADTPVTPQTGWSGPTTPVPAEPRHASRELIVHQQTYPLAISPPIAAILRAYQSVRREQPRLSAEELQHFLRHGGTGLPDVEQSLACYDGVSLVRLIDWNNPQSSVHLILEQLSSSRTLRTARDRNELALHVLDVLAGLEDAPEHTYELRLDLAEALFNVAVRPEANSLPVQERLNAVLLSSWTADARFGRDLMYRIVDERKPLGVPEQAYRMIVRLQAEALYRPDTRVFAEPANSAALTASTVRSAGPQPSAGGLIVILAAGLALIALVIVLGMALGN